LHWQGPGAPSTEEQTDPDDEEEIIVYEDDEDDFYDDEDFDQQQAGIPTWAKIAAAGLVVTGGALWFTRRR
jgi:hypothetical protein